MTMGVSQSQKKTASAALMPLIAEGPKGGIAQNKSTSSGGFTTCLATMTCNLPLPVAVCHKILRWRNLQQ